jgi:arginase
MGKTKKQAVSLFGIDDCHKPRKNFTFKANKSRKNKSMSKNKGLQKPYNYKTVILFPHNLGQTKTGTEKAPKYLKKFVNRKKHVIKTVKNTGNFFKNIKDLYKANEKSTGKIINVGGDHSMSIATIAEVIYFDAHADINTYKSSNSKHYHGMPLSFITGIDHNKNFSFIKNNLPFENLLYIGSRCWDIFEVNEVHKKHIKFLTPDNINNDFENSLNKIMTFIGNSPIHVSFDVDSVDPKYIPSTGTPVKNGIDMGKAITILDNLNNNSEIVNMDITELNMELGTKRDGVKSGVNTEKLFHKFLD